MVNGKKLLASVLVGAMVITGSPVAPAWSVANVEAATVTYADSFKALVEGAADKAVITLTQNATTGNIKIGDATSPKTITIDLGTSTLIGNITVGNNVTLIMKGTGIYKGTITGTYTLESGNYVDTIVTGHYDVDDTDGKVSCVADVEVRVGTETKVAKRVAKHELSKTEDWVPDTKGGYKSVTVTTTCANGCTGYPTTVESTAVTSAETQPNCSEAGKIVYTAKNGETVIATKTVETKPATGHIYSRTSKADWNWTKNANGSYDAKVVLKCGTCSEEYETPATVTTVKTEPATCSTRGYTTYNATVTGKDGKTYSDDEIVYTNMSFEELKNPANHGTGITRERVVWDIPKGDDLKVAKGKLSYTILATCSKCGKEYPLRSGEATPTNVVKATCTTGTVETYDALDLKFTNAQGAQQNVECEKPNNAYGTVTYNDCPGHIIDTNKAYKILDAATCTDPGYIAGTCKVCNKSYSSDISITEKVLATGHKVKGKYTYVPATCLKGAYKQYYACDNCTDSCSDTDDEATKELFRVYEENSKPLGHKYVATAVAENEESVTFTNVRCANTGCSVKPFVGDKDTETFNYSELVIDNNPSNCQASVSYLIPADNNKNAIKKDIIIAKANATGAHAYEAKFVWGKDFEKPVVTMTLTCTNKDSKGTACPEKHVISIENKDLKIETISETKATCTATGSKVVKATYDGTYGKFVSEQATITADKVAHVYVKNGDAKVTCDWEKSELYIPCKECGEVKTVKGVITKTTTEQTISSTALFVDSDGNAYTKVRKIGNIGDVTAVYKNNVAATLSNVIIADVPYTGKAIVPVELTTFFKNAELKEGTDYKVEFKNNVNVGKATATITGLGLFTGTVPVEFNIVKANVKIEVNDITKTYGDKDRIIVKLRDNNGDLISDDAVKAIIDREAGEDVGTYKVTVKVEGTDNYNKPADKVVTLTINPRKATVVLKNQTKYAEAKDPKFTYTTKNVVPGHDLGLKITREAGEAVGEYEIVATYDNPNYDVEFETATLTIKAAPAPAPKAQSITTKKLTASYKVAAVKKAAKTFSIGATCTSKKTVTAKKVSGSKKITVSTTGKVKIAKGTKKGTYTAKVKLSAPATSSYKAATKTVTVKVTVK